LPIKDVIKNAFKGEHINNIINNAAMLKYKHDFWVVFVYSIINCELVKDVEDVIIIIINYNYNFINIIYYFINYIFY
jgi:hypothetical protein